MNKIDCWRAFQLEVLSDYHEHLDKVDSEYSNYIRLMLQHKASIRNQMTRVYQQKLQIISSHMHLLMLQLDNPNQTTTPSPSTAASTTTITTPTTAMTATPTTTNLSTNSTKIADISSVEPTHEASNTMDNNLITFSKNKSKTMDQQQEKEQQQQPSQMETKTQIERKVKSKKKLSETKPTNKKHNGGSKMYIRKKSSNGGWMYHCRQCDRIFRASASAGQHFNARHSKKYQCNVCGTCCHSNTHLQKHKERLTKDGSCINSFKSYYTKIMAGYNENNNTWDKTKVKYQCTMCTHVSIDLCSAEYHYIKKHTTKYQCLFCKQCFATESKLLTHQETHDGKKLYKCSVCGKEFVVMSNFITHSKIHESDEKVTFKCGYCDQVFDTKVKKIQHQVIHRNEKPFKCGICNKRYRYEKPLKNHLSRCLPAI